MKTSIYSKMIEICNIVFTKMFALNFLHINSLEKSLNILKFKVKMHFCAVKVTWINWHLEKLVGIKLFSSKKYNFYFLKYNFLCEEKTKKITNTYV